MSRSCHPLSAVRSGVCIGTASLLAMATACCSGGCSNGDSDSVDVFPAPPIRLVVSGDTHGWIVPCGCTSNQSGGLPRRGAYVQSLKQDNEVVLASAGGAAGGDSAYELLRFEAIVRGEMEMELAAHNLGGSELAFGAEAIRDLQSRHAVPFVSANARDAGGNYITERFRRWVTVDTWIALIGVANPADAKNGITIDDPQAAILETLALLPEDIDTIVVLAHLPEAQLRDLAASIPEVDYVIGGPTGQSVLPTKVGSVTVAAATNKGKFLVELELPRRSEIAAFRTGPVRGTVVELTGQWTDHPDQLDNLSWFRDQLAARDFTAQESGFALTSLSAPADHFAGSDSCADCHVDDCDIWQDSGHAHAWKTLEADRSHVDSYCQQCHTTGFGMADGFQSARRSLNRVDVGCESCHGPAAAHAANSSTRTLFRAEDQCQRCHDPENSPEFDYAGYWERIQHGS